MAGPFFQGNIKDLLEVAGPSQGGFLLGQLMREEQQRQRAELEKSQLANLEAQAKAKREAELHPINVQQQRAALEGTQATTAGTQARTAQTQNELDTFNAAGGSQAAGEAKNVERRSQAVKLSGDFQEQITKMIQETPWSPNVGQEFQRMAEQFKTNGLPMPPSLVQAALAAAQSEAGWKKFQQQMYSMSPKARETQQQGDIQMRNQEHLQRLKSETALRIAEVRARQARESLRVKDFEHAYLQMRQAADAALEAGNKPLSDKLMAEAANYLKLKGQFDLLKASGRTMGQLDVEAAGRGELKFIGAPPLPTNPPLPQAGAPSKDTQVPEATIEFVRDPKTGKLVPKQ